MKKARNSRSGKHPVSPPPPKHQDADETTTTGDTETVVPAAEPKFKNRFAVSMNLDRQLGFALSVVLAFLGGIYFGGRQLTVPQGLPAPKNEPTEFKTRTSTTPVEPEDFFPPAEFRRQKAIMLGCYYFLNTNPQLYVDIVQAIEGRLPIVGLVESEVQAEQGRDLMRKHNLPADAMRFHIIPADTVWVRDYAPFIIRRPDGSVGMIDAKYLMQSNVEDRRKDNEMAASLSKVLDLPLRSIPLVLEGGNFLSNGDGIAVATNRLFQTNQDYQFSKIQIATILNDFMGVRHCYLVPALEGEATGHVDMLMSFVAKNIAVVGEIPLEVDPENSTRLDTAATNLAQLETTMGTVKVFRIPMPPPSGQNWRSYTNIILANGILLMPSFSDVDPALEDRAEAVYTTILPGWKIKRIPCDRLVKENGQLHCISYNIPNYVNLENLISGSR